MYSAPQIAIPKCVDYERIKIILDWGQYPRDLDSHIESFNPYHHAYFSRQSTANLYLDHDDTTSYGPETVTVTEPRSAEKYSYYVHNYSNGGESYSDRLSFSKARVRVYINNEYKTTFRIKEHQTGTLWHVFDVKNGFVIPVNRVKNDHGLEF